MEKAAVALALLGFAVGIIFRLRILLLILALLLLVSIAFSLISGFTLLNSTLTVLAAQAIVQGGYFLGLLIRALFGVVYRIRPMV